MAYRPLQPADGGADVSPPSTLAVSRPRTFDRAFVRSQRSSSVDDLPLLDMSASSRALAKTADVTQVQVHMDDLAYGARSAFGNNGHYVNLERLARPSLIDSLRARMNSTYRYIRASGPAYPCKSFDHNFDHQHRQMPTGWRFGTWVCCSAVTLCVVLEVVLLIYAMKRSNSSKASAILLEGTCEDVRRLELWLLFPLNIVGTILIGTSNYVMQVVSASERKDINQAHARARPIAVAGVRFNDLGFTYGNKIRRGIWWTLGLSSLPIHFLLNVAVYSSIQASNTGVLIVSDNFGNDTGWDYCGRLPSNATSAETVACSLYSNYTSDHTVHMTTSQCLKQYSNGFQTNASSVIVVTNPDSTPWYNPPLSAKVSDYVSYGLPCRAKYQSCTLYSSYNYSWYDGLCPYGYFEISDRNFNFAFDSSYTNVTFDFLPFCQNKTYYNKDKTYNSSEILTTSQSYDDWTYLIYDELYLRSNDTLSEITSIKALFSAFQYQYWATAAVTGDYLQRDYQSLLDNRDPRSWLCPRDSLESGQLCDPLVLQRNTSWLITPESMSVKECHVLPKPELCALRYSSGILIITICFDFIKLLAMFTAVNLVSKPLITLGDVIESFLQDPDPYTKDCYALNQDQAHNWASNARTAIHKEGFIYVKDRFGIDFLNRSMCSYCGKPLILDRFSSGVDLSLIASHRHCGMTPAVSHSSLHFGEQGFAWLCDGGPWWTTFLTNQLRPKPTIPKRQRWFHAPSQNRWKWSSYFYIPTVALAIGYFAINFRNLLARRLLSPWTTGFTAPDPNSLLTGGLSGTSSIYTAAILINAPQVAFSMLYFVFNATLTMMHTAHEWTSFSVHRKALRVSSPRGEQRATYWLQLPWTYSIPLIITSGSMHWLLSRSLYIVKVDVYGYLGELEPDKGYFACGYSPIPALLLIVILALMGFALCGLALRRFPTGMPLVGFNSLAIAAACHADPNEEDLELKPLMWGVLGGYSKDGIPHCSFSAKPVTALQSYHFE